MPAIVYGRAFVIAQDKRLVDLVTTIEATALMVDVYVTSVHDVYLWCLRHLTGAALSGALANINVYYGSTYDSVNPWDNPWLGPLPVASPLV